MMPSIESSATVTKYLADLEHNFPNQLFQSTEHRSSKFPAEIRPQVTRKENHATRMAALALPTAFNNRRRHETLLRFMLINDSATVAVKIPVFLTKGDVEYYRTQGFNLRFESAVITGTLISFKSEMAIYISWTISRKHGKKPMPMCNSQSMRLLLRAGLGFR